MNSNYSTQSPRLHQTQPYSSPSDSQFFEDASSTGNLFGDMVLPTQRRPVWADRRQNQRISVSARAQVRGNDCNGARFETAHDAAQLQDLSAHGLRLLLNHNVKLDQRLFIVFPGVLSLLGEEGAAGNTYPAPASVAVIGIVRRCSARGDSTAWQVGVQIVRHRFIYNA